MTQLDFPGASKTSENIGRDLPPNVWIPNDVPSIQIYWLLVGEDFEVVVQLLDASLLDQNDPGIIVWTLLRPDRRIIPFSLYDEDTGQAILDGKLEWVAAPNTSSTSASPQLWLKNAHYPGDGYTAAQQIA